MNIAEFARWVIESSAFSGCDLDGGDVQQKAIECGLLVETTYDPSVHGTATMYDAEPGDPWCAFSDSFKNELRSTNGGD
jgi:hypothetical protein